MVRDVRYQVWDVKCSKDGQKTFIKNLDNKGSINICNENDSVISILVEGTRRMQLEKLLRDRDIAFVVTTADTGSIGAPRLGKNLVTRSIKQMNKDQVMDWHNFYPLHVIYSFLSSLEQQYPSRCTVHCIGYTVEGREIKMLKISSSHAGNSGSWLDGAIHAREWISAAVVTYIAHHLATHFDGLPESVTNKDW
ncbi:unnamed protein product [Plutella xylostella]|uniref:(diamondback moth) hypothetical protein n=1 Tax=Plutella xylostella TaxID=51655 RepID=A0A8S4E9J5_PLUXY|nr:unnamed protein product [Plutella xylostella]